jgi:OHCU decarboxylase
MSGNACDYDLVVAETVGEALRYISDGRRPIAGGTDLMVLFDAGRLPYRRLVSVQGIKELRNIEVTDQYVYVGACVTHSEIRMDPVLQREFDLICRAAAWTGGIANQNCGTLGGNIVNASPAADSLPALLVYDVQLELMSRRGARWVSYDSFHTGYKSMQMETDELLTRIRCPRPTGPRVEYGRKVGARKAQAIAKLGMAAIATMNGQSTATVRVAMSSMAPVPLRCTKTESALTGVVITPAVRREAAAMLASEVSPIDDIRSSREYRRRVAINLLGEFIDLLDMDLLDMDLLDMDLLEPLTQWNRMDHHAAVAIVQKCCGSARWAEEIAALRPFANPQHLFQMADRIWNSLPHPDHMEAFRAHPRIGDAAVPAKSWAAGEQSGMQSASGALREEMAERNREYAARFGFVYIICATGRSAEEMLDLLRLRLKNSPATELQEALEQQRLIMQLRLRKWLA